MSGFIIENLKRQLTTNNKEEVNMDLEQVIKQSKYDYKK